MRISGTRRPSISPASAAALTVSLDIELISAAADWLRFGKLAHFGGNDREALAMFAGTSRFDSRVQSEQIGLAGDLLDDADLLGDGAHGADGAGDGIAACFRILGGLTGDLLRLGGVIGVLLDVGSHLLHRSRSLFSRCRLFGRALRHLLRTCRKLLAARGDILRCGDGVGNDAAQSFHHLLQRQAEHILVGERLRRDHQIAVGDLCSDIGGGAQVCNHALHRQTQHVLVGERLHRNGEIAHSDAVGNSGCVAQVRCHDIDGVDQVLDLVIGLDLDLVIEIAERHGLGDVRHLGQTPADAESDPGGNNNGEYEEADCHTDQNGAGTGVFRSSRPVGGMQILDNFHVQTIQSLQKAIGDLRTILHRDFSSVSVAFRRILGC